jgi:hypothetical protein
MKNTIKIASVVFEAVLLAASLGLGAHSTKAQPFPGTVNECASAVQNTIGGWSIQNACSQPIDLGLAYRVDGSNGPWTFRVYRQLNPRFEVSTPNCFQCGYDIYYKAIPSSEHASNEVLMPETR